MRPLRLAFEDIRKAGRELVEHFTSPDTPSLMQTARVTRDIKIDVPDAYSGRAIYKIDGHSHEWRVARHTGQNQYAISEIHVRTHMDFSLGEMAGDKFVKSEKPVPSMSGLSRNEAAAHLAVWESEQKAAESKRIHVQSPQRMPMHFSRAKPAALATA